MTSAIVLIGLGMAIHYTHKAWKNVSRYFRGWDPEQ
jgi:hypothetical protein